MLQSKFLLRPLLLWQDYKWREHVHACTCTCTCISLPLYTCFPFSSLSSCAPLPLLSLSLPPSHPPLLPSSHPPPTLQIQDSASRLLPLLHQPERCATDTHCPFHTGADQSAALLRPHWAGQCIHYITIHVYMYMYMYMYIVYMCITIHVHVYVCTLSVYVCVCVIAARCAPAVTSYAECVRMSTSSTSTSSVWTALSSSQSLAHVIVCCQLYMLVESHPPEAAHFS